MSEYQFILVETVHHITTIALNRPDKRNALNGQMIRELSDALGMIAKDPESRVVIIHGNGNHFCAGADINWMQKIASGSYNDNYDDAQFLADLMHQLYTFPKPTIGLGHGAALGGGLGILSTCDIAIAAKSTIFGFSEVKIGIVPSIISPYVIAAMGERAAHYYFLTAEQFDCEEAYRLGLIHEIIDDEQLLSSGASLAKLILQNSPNALASAKQLIRTVAKEKITPQLAQKTAEHLANLRSSVEAQEGLKAFVEKRKPNW